jgi:hypothetical protein
MWISCDIIIVFLIWICSFAYWAEIIDFDYHVNKSQLLVVSLSHKLFCCLSSFFSSHHICMTLVFSDMLMLFTLNPHDLISAHRIASHLMLSISISISHHIVQALKGVVLSHPAPRQASGWCMVRTGTGSPLVLTAGHRITPSILPPKTRKRILEAEKSRNPTGCYGYVFTAKRTYEQQQQHAGPLRPYLHYLFLFLYSAVWCPLPQSKSIELSHYFWFSLWPND